MTEREAEKARIEFCNWLQTSQDWEMDFSQAPIAHFVKKRGNGHRHKKKTQ